MWINPSALERLEPQGHYFNREIPHYNFNPAGPLHAEIAAAAGIGTYIDSVYDHHFDKNESDFHTRAKNVFALFHKHETAQANRILNAIKNIKGSRIIGQHQAEEGRRAATISLAIEGMSSMEAAAKLAEKEVAVRNGDFYAVRCLEGLGIEDVEDGIIRISLVHYNSEADVDRLVAALGAL
jgi:selenocysteine lyase/cysteine desulfurase